MHPTLLPRHRGRAPIPWTILTGLARTGVTLFEIVDATADSGSIVGQVTLDVARDETATTLFARIAEAHVELTRELVPQLLARTAPRIPQDPTRASSWPKRAPADGIIDWETRAPYLYDWVRAQTRPYPGAFTFLGDEKVIVWGARPVELAEARARGDDRRRPSGRPGRRVRRGRSRAGGDPDRGGRACRWGRGSDEHRSPSARGHGGNHVSPVCPLLLESVGNLPVPHTPPRSSPDRGRSMSRVLVLAAHPDDEVLGMGGTIAVHADRGDEVRIVVVTDGSSTQYPGDAEIRARKEDEALRAAAELGVTDYVHLDLPDMRLDTLPHVEVNRVVEEHVRDFAPARVYTPHPDVNRDHRVLFDSVAVATRPMPGQPVRRAVHLRADVEHGVDAALAQLVRPELVRRRHRDDRAEGGGVRPLRDGATRVPASTQRARHPGGGGVLRLELRLRPRRAVRARAKRRTGLISAPWRGGHSS